MESLIPLFLLQSQWNPNWSTILMTSIVIVGGIIVNAAMVGFLVGRHKEKVDTLALKFDEHMKTWNQFRLEYAQKTGNGNLRKEHH